MTVADGDASSCETAKLCIECGAPVPAVCLTYDSNGGLMEAPWPWERCDDCEVAWMTALDLPDEDPTTGEIAEALSDIIDDAAKTAKFTDTEV